jgi:hypothetical protein
VSTNSELYRRGIVLPLTADAEVAIRSSSADEHTPTRILSLDEALFYELWSFGLFERINRICGSLIDEHEEAEIRPERVSSVTGVIEEFLLRPEVIGNKRTFLLSLKQLCQLAQSENRSVFFVL